MADDILNRARSKYGFLKNLNVNVIVNPKDNGMYAETWPINEPGAQDQPRPKELPINVLGIEINKPDSFSEDDLAGEALHVDPLARQTAESITKSISPAQLSKILTNSNDYELSIKLGLDEARATQNAMDSMIRGYVVGQWPKEAIDEIGLDQSQRALLEGLKDYATTGKSERELQQEGFDSSLAR
jgi:hypothetical protein